MSVPAARCDSTWDGHECHRPAGHPGNHRVVYEYGMTSYVGIAPSKVEWSDDVPVVSHNFTVQAPEPGEESESEGFHWARLLTLFYFAALFTIVLVGTIIILGMLR